MSNSQKNLLDPVKIHPTKKKGVNKWFTGEVRMATPKLPVMPGGSGTATEKKT